MKLKKNFFFGIFFLKKIKYLKIVKDNNIDYFYKYFDRSNINKLLYSKDKFFAHKYFDIIIIKNNKITDFSYGNLCFFDSSKWITPKSPLLKGTKRQYLLDNNFIIEKDMNILDIKNFERISLINAMIDLGDLVIDIKNVKF